MTEGQEALEHSDKRGQFGKKRERRLTITEKNKGSFTQWANWEALCEENLINLN